MPNILNPLNPPPKSVDAAKPIIDINAQKNLTAQNVIQPSSVNTAGVLSVATPKQNVEVQRVVNAGFIPQNVVAPVQSTPGTPEIIQPASPDQAKNVVIPHYANPQAVISQKIEADKALQTSLQAAQKLLDTSYKSGDGYNLTKYVQDGNDTTILPQLGFKKEDVQSVVSSVATQNALMKELAPYKSGDGYNITQYLYDKLMKDLDAGKGRIPNPEIVKWGTGGRDTSGMSETVFDYSGGINKLKQAGFNENDINNATISASTIYAEKHKPVINPENVAQWQKLNAEAKSQNVISIAGGKQNTGEWANPAVDVRLVLDRPDFTSDTPYANVSDQAIQQSLAGFKPSATNPMPPFAGEQAGNKVGTYFDEKGNRITLKTQADAINFQNRLNTLAQNTSLSIMAQDNVQLPDGQWMPKASFNKLPQTYQQIAMAAGLPTLNELIRQENEFAKNQQAFYNNMNAKLSPYGTYSVSLAKQVNPTDFKNADVSTIQPVPKTYTIGGLVKFQSDNPNDSTTLKTMFGDETANNVKQIIDTSDKALSFIRSGNLNQSQFQSLVNNMALSGIEGNPMATLDTTLKQFNALPSDKQREIALSFANDKSKDNILLAIYKDMQIQSKDDLVTGLLTAPVITIAKPFAEASLGEKVTPIDVISSAGMTALVGLTGGGASIAGAAFGKVGAVGAGIVETGITGGFLAGGIKNTIDTYQNPMSTTNDKRSALIMDGIMAIATAMSGIGLSSAVQAKTPQTVPVMENGMVVFKPVSEPITPRSLGYSVADRLEILRDVIESPLVQQGLTKAEIDGIINSFREKGVSDEVIAALSDSKVKYALTQQLPRLMEIALDNTNIGMDKAVRFIIDLPKTSAKTILKGVDKGVFTVFDLPNKAFEKGAPLADRSIASASQSIDKLSESLFKLQDGRPKVDLSGVNYLGKDNFYTPNKAFVSIDQAISATSQSIDKLSEAFFKLQDDIANRPKTDFIRVGEDSEFYAPNKALTSIDSLILETNQKIEELSRAFFKLQDDMARRPQTDFIRVGEDDEFYVANKTLASIDKMIGETNQKIAELSSAFFKLQDDMARKQVDLSGLGKDNFYEPNKNFTAIENTVSKIGATLERVPNIYDNMLAQYNNLKIARTEFTEGLKQAKLNHMVSNLREVYKQLRLIDVILRNIEELRKVKLLNEADVQMLQQMKSYYLNKAEELSTDTVAVVDISGTENELNNAKEIFNKTNNQDLKEVLKDHIINLEKDIQKAKQSVQTTTKPEPVIVEYPVEGETMKGAEPVVIEESEKGLSGITEKTPEKTPIQTPIIAPEKTTGNQGDKDLSGGNQKNAPVEVPLYTRINKSSPSYKGDRESESDENKPDFSSIDAVSPYRINQTGNVVNVSVRPNLGNISENVTADSIKVRNFEKQKNENEVEPQPQPETDPMIKKPVPTPTQTEIKETRFPLFIPKKKNKDDSPAEKKRKEFSGSIGFKWGFGWWFLKYPYATQKDIAFFRIPPEGVTVVPDAKSVYETIQKITGKPPSKQLVIPIGIQTVYIRKPPSTPGAKGTVSLKMNRAAKKGKSTGSVRIIS